MGSNFGFPSEAPVVNEDGYINVTWAQWATRVHSVANAAVTSGTTSQRPTKGVWIGLQYYDTTLNKPVYVSSANPIVWRDAAGTVV